MHAGFQFQFDCSHCHKTWRSPFRPYRLGQFSSLLNRFSFFFGPSSMANRAGSGLSDARLDSARAGALSDAMREAETMFTTCPTCHQVVCESCFSREAGCCSKCVGESTRRPTAGGDDQPSAGAGVYCPNCQTPSDGGRFCAECGYDLASTHKSCPACGVMTSRSARFCTDCGHAF
ncbi:zinc ribbon domain-containing protein [Ideonella sp. 4Y11]|uniref:Zinc ribbon domain-containing protein n=1 Tax=Ideonella aquatica TaxID=2824119 RepID=A0A940YR07_9BURK|nr:zinc ribbon domain-containing protein [Ideonella aquatica]MBQ0961312.1 zinc ribbon domain-containing protein [Ideonella aquatica]